MAAALSAVVLPKCTYNTSLNSGFISAHQLRYNKFDFHVYLLLRAIWTSDHLGSDHLGSAQILLRANKFRSTVHKAASTAVEIEKESATAKCAPVLPCRVGHCFDLHRLEPGLPLIIGGISIPHDRGCDAHSDGDVLLHCVVDAILGALGLPDIGQLFPDNDPKWRGADSSVFLKEAVKLMHEAGYGLGNLDATLILQRPKVPKQRKIYGLPCIENK